MILVLILSAIVIGVVGALIGGLIAFYLPRPVLFWAWVVLSVCAAYIFLQSNEGNELERIGAKILVFVVLLPSLFGSLIAGSIVRRRLDRRSEELR